MPTARDLATGRRFSLEADESLLTAIERDDGRSNLVGCRNGGCGVCRIQLLAGRVRLGKMSRRHVSADAERQRFALACRTFVDWEVEFRPAPLPAPRPTISERIIDHA